MHKCIIYIIKTDVKYYAKIN